MLHWRILYTTLNPFCFPILHGSSRGTYPKAIYCHILNNYYTKGSQEVRIIIELHLPLYIQPPKTISYKHSTQSCKRSFRGEPNV